LWRFDFVAAFGAQPGAAIAQKLSGGDGHWAGGEASGACARLRELP
jgi:hypothetical protein